MNINAFARSLRVFTRRWFDCVKAHRFVLAAGLCVGVLGFSAMLPASDAELRYTEYSAALGFGAGGVIPASCESYNPHVAASECVVGNFTSLPACSIAPGGAGCYATVSWTETGYAAGNLVDLATCDGSSVGTYPYGSQSESVYVPRGGECFNLTDLTWGLVSASGNVSAECGGGSTWNGSACECPAGTYPDGASCVSTPPSTPACTWKAYEDALINDYMEVRQCVPVPSGYNACTAPNSRCGAGGGYFGTPACPGGATVGGDATGYSNGYTCYIGSSKNMMPTGFDPENGICYAQALVSDCGTPTGPDLRSADLSLSTGPYAEGTPITLTASVQNVGDTNTGSGFTDKFTYQWNGTGGTWLNFSDNTISQGALASGASSVDSKTFTPSQTGTLYIKHCVDVNENVDEGVNEDPNCSIGGGVTVEASTPPVGTVPIGYFDYANCTTAVGWTCDPDAWNTPLEVHFYEGSTYVGLAKADRMRESAVGTACGGGTSAHGYLWTIPDSLKTGVSRTITAYPINIGNTSGGNPPHGSATIPAGCYPNQVPALSSPTAINITSTSARIGATVVSDGGSPITARGTCWGMSPNPSTNCAQEGGTALGAFAHTRPELSPGTTYYYRGYAVNSVGTAFSPGGTFTTTPAEPPAPTVTASGAACGGNLIASWGDAAGATGYDLQYKLSSGSSWTVLEDVTSSRALPGLTPGASYDVQLRAKNASGASPWSAYGVAAASAACVVPVTTPIGYFDGASCTTAVGWTCDPDAWNTPLEVHFYEGPTFVGSTMADKVREAAVGVACGNGTSAHGYFWDFPDSLKTGVSRTITAYPINIGNTSGGNPPHGSATIPAGCYPNKTLTVLKNGNGTVSGTGITCGADCNESYPHNTAVTLTAAAQPGFKFTGWSGACSGTALSCTVTMDEAKAVTATFVNSNPIGYFDYANCTTAVGWTCDPDAWNTPLEVHFYEGSTYVGLTKADKVREAAVGVACGNGTSAHGYFWDFPDSLKTGVSRTITAYPINIGNTSGGNPPHGSATIPAGCYAIPSAPSAVTAVPKACGTQTTYVDWDDVSGATSYSVYDADTGGWIGNSIGSAFDHVSAPGNTFRYFVRANNVAGQQSGMSPASPNATIPGVCKPVEPPAPTVTASGAACGGNLIASWGDAAGATGYDLQYKLSSGSSWTVLEDVTSSRALPGLTPGASYDVQLRAKNASGASPWSAYGVAAASAACVVPVTTPIGYFDYADCSVGVGWTCDPDEWNTQLEVHFYEGSTFVGSTNADQMREPAVGTACGGGTSAHGFVWTIPDSLKTGASRTINAHALNVGNTTGGNPPFDQTDIPAGCYPIPPAPGAVWAVSGACGTAQNIVDWPDVPGATSYSVYDADTGGWIGNSLGSDFFHTSAPGNTFRYFVRANNVAGQQSGMSPASPNATIPGVCTVADLVPNGGITVNGDLSRGETVTVEVTVTNSGNGDAGPFESNVTIQNGSGGWDPVGSQGHPGGLAAGDSVTDAIPVTLTQSGSVNIQYCVDSKMVDGDGEVSEGAAGESNNCIQRTITVDDPAGCTGRVIDQCRVTDQSHNQTSGGCRFGTLGGVECKYKCKNGSWTDMTGYDSNSTCVKPVISLSLCNVSGPPSCSSTRVVNPGEVVRAHWESNLDSCDVTMGDTYPGGNTGFVTGGHPNGDDSTVSVALPDLSVPMQITCRKNGELHQSNIVTLTTNAVEPTISVTVAGTGKNAVVVSRGTKVDVTWDTNNGNEKACTLSGGGLDTNTLLNDTTGTEETGTAQVDIQGRTIFKITCGSLSALKTVDVVGDTWEQ